MSTPRRTRRTQVRRRWIVMLALCTLLLGWFACGEGETKLEGPRVPEEFSQGEAKFNAHCAVCHGEQARGTVQGPPLAHKIYEPSHHGDAAFQFAAANGVRAHHWKFGDMPKLPGVTTEDVEQIIKYVRYLQRQAGIQ